MFVIIICLLLACMPGALHWAHTAHAYSQEQHRGVLFRAGW